MGLFIAPYERFILPKGTKMTPALLQCYINKHKIFSRRYKRLRKLYESNHPILEQPRKEAHKPDNRIVVNFPKYIVDTLNGYFIGVPIKVTHDEESIAEYLEYVDAYNNQDDNNAELSKMCSEFGCGYELLYMDENAEIGITNIEPDECFVIYDDSILHRPMYGVRYYKDWDDVERGSFSDANAVTYFTFDGGYRFEAPQAHPFGDVPIIEYQENRECHAAFEDVITLVNAYNKALSEKANDVDYYADAYLKILGKELDDQTLIHLRDSRIINFSGEDTDKLIVEFLSKPNGDTTQENLINRLERLVFQLSMVANINDENFGNASGISLKYKLQSMSNLAKIKERKFMAGMQRRYRMIAHCPVSKMREEDWVGIKYHFTRNLPNNLLEESQIAGNLAGITSEETQLKVLSIVDNVKEEIERKKAEQDEMSYETDYPTGRSEGELIDRLAEATTTTE